MNQFSAEIFSYSLVAFYLLNLVITNYSNNYVSHQQIDYQDDA